IEVWNPDEPKEMMKMIRLGVDSIGTNRPDILLNLLRKMNMR
ncbi:glycerophosphodiester phosphodiesterase, partial [Candidatus Bathyarchaeota archaeon]